MTESYAVKLQMQSDPDHWVMMNRTEKGVRQQVRENTHTPTESDKERLTVPRRTYDTEDRDASSEWDDCNTGTQKQCRSWFDDRDMHLVSVILLCKDVTTWIPWQSRWRFKRTTYHRECFWCYHPFKEANVEDMIMSHGPSSSLNKTSCHVIVSIAHGNHQWVTRHDCSDESRTITSTEKSTK